MEATNATPEQAAILAELEQFTGSETWYRHGLVRRITFTEGVKFLADKCGAYWLIDEIAIAQISAKIGLAEQPFQLWKLTVTGSTAVLVCEDGNDTELFRKDKYRQFNPSNGWGTYEGLVDFVSRYLAACEHWGDAKVRVSR